MQIELESTKSKLFAELASCRRQLADLHEKMAVTEKQRQETKVSAFRIDPLTKTFPLKSLLICRCKNWI